MDLPHGRRRTDLSPNTERLVRVLGLAAVLFLAGGSLWVSVHAQQAADDVAEVQTIFRVGQIGACERVNGLRRRDNKVAETQYETLNIAAGLLEDMPQARRFRRLARTVGYIPRTDCDSAVGTPALYQAPTEVPIHTLSARERRNLRQEGYAR